MENYETLEQVGHGSYGAVLKCRHRDSCCLVAIKRFIDSDDDQTVKKIALREIKLLKQLRHDNLVNLLEVWRHRRHWYLVFEFVERTLLDELEKNPFGFDANTSRLYLFQILRAAAFCHQQHVIHRDIKPENILISRGDVVKLCDFGFARTVTSAVEGVAYTDYVATRWYRAPELLVGDTKYGRPVDVWAIGCLTMEMLTGQPLFPGDTDLDQIHQIIRCIGSLTARHQELFHRNPVFSGISLPEYSCRVPLEQKFPKTPNAALVLVRNCLRMDPAARAECSEMLRDPFFTQDSFHVRVLEELNVKMSEDQRQNSTLPKIVKTPRPDVSAVDVKIPRAKGKKRFKDAVDRNVKETRMQSGDKERSPSNQPKSIGTTSESHTAAEPFPGLGFKRADDSAKGSITMKNTPGNGVEPRKDDGNGSSETHPGHRNAQRVLRLMKAASSHPVDCHSKQMSFRDRTSTCLNSSATETRQHFQSAQNEDLGRNTLNRKRPKVLIKRQTSDFSNVGSAATVFLKANVEAPRKEDSKKVSLEQRKEDFLANRKRDTLKPVQADSTLQRNLHDSCVNATKPVIPAGAKPTKTSKKALHLNPDPSTDTTVFSPIVRSPFDGAAQPPGRGQPYKVPKKTKRVSHKPLEDPPEDNQPTEPSKNVPRSCLKTSLLTSAAENQSETSRLKRDDKNCSHYHRIQQCTAQKSKQNSTSSAAKTQNAETLERLVKRNKTDGAPAVKSSAQTKCKDPNTSGESKSTRKSRISINERVAEMESKVKTGATLSAVGENRAAKQKFSQTELSSCRLSSIVCRPPLTMSPGGHLTRGSMRGSVSPLVQQRCNTTGQLDPPIGHEAEGRAFHRRSFGKTTDEKRQRLHNPKGGTTSGTSLDQKKYKRCSY